MLSIMGFTNQFIFPDVNVDYWIKVLWPELAKSRRNECKQIYGVR
ncbi:hypothetical protein THF1A12_320010 [Vibrio jasicida]|uniref:Uncharacterized protein n=1 Tax=Vibrio jasicida TaxID=766224 RepID=A0AAU9QR19_9VIBR|nr:hypothetical protein THF1A12_320010 [Vibrio jasicida]